MSEPKAVAARAEPVTEGIWTWGVSDDRVGGMLSSSAAVEEAPGEIVLIDPVRVDEQELDRLGDVTAILITNGKHMRSAPHYRDLTGAAIWAPVHADFTDEQVDETFTEGNELPGGLKVIEIIGPARAEHAFYLKRAGGVIIIGDALLNLEGGGLSILPEKYNPDPGKTKQSCKKILDYDFDVMLFGHGEPIRSGAKEKLRTVLK